MTSITLKEYCKYKNMSNTDKLLSACKMSLCRCNTTTFSYQEYLKKQQVLEECGLNYPTFVFDSVVEGCSFSDYVNLLSIIPTGELQIKNGKKTLKTMGMGCVSYSLPKEIQVMINDEKNTTSGGVYTYQTTNPSERVMEALNDFFKVNKEEELLSSCTVELKSEQLSPLNGEPIRTCSYKQYTKLHDSSTDNRKTLIFDPVKVNSKISEYISLFNSHPSFRIKIVNGHQSIKMTPLGGSGDCITVWLTYKSLKRLPGPNGKMVKRQTVMSGRYPSEQVDDELSKLVDSFFDFW